MRFQASTYMYKSIQLQVTTQSERVEIILPPEQAVFMRDNSISVSIYHMLPIYAKRFQV